MAVTIKKYNSDFSDINMLFSMHPVSKDVTKKLDAEAVKSSVRNLIMTYYYEKPFHPEKGSRVSRLLFENWDPSMAAVIDQEIRNILTNYEPRIEFLGTDIVDESERNALQITIYFKVINTSELVNLNVLLERLR